jgi:hypothetical protein
LQIYESNASRKRFFGLSAHHCPCYPEVSHQGLTTLGGASEVLSGMVGRAGGVGGPRRPLKRPVFGNGARQARGGR